MTVLLGLLEDPVSLATRALVAQGAQPEAVRSAATAAVGRGSAPAGHVPFSAGARALLEATLRQAHRLGHNYLGTEHVLLALLEEGSPTAPVLTGLGVTRERSEEWVLRRWRNGDAAE